MIFGISFHDEMKFRISSEPLPGGNLDEIFIKVSARKELQTGLHNLRAEFKQWKSTARSAPYSGGAAASTATPAKGDAGSKGKGSLKGKGKGKGKAAFPNGPNGEKKFLCKEWVSGSCPHKVNGGLCPTSGMWHAADKLDQLEHVNEWFLGNSLSSEHLTWRFLEQNA